jgi:hypothetical protein
MKQSIYKNQKKYSKTQENRTNCVRAEMKYVGSIWKKGKKAKKINQTLFWVQIIIVWHDHI